MSSYGKTSSTLWGPTLLDCSSQVGGQMTNSSAAAAARDGIEVSLHTLPRPLQREFHHVFDERNLSMLDEIEARCNTVVEFLAIPTNQHAREDLVAVGDKIEAEKDRLLNVFMVFARELCLKIRNDLGYWADYIDPCSGLPMLTLNCNKVYSEVDGMECCLGYKSYNAGFCKILTHPKWGSSVYPATIFCFAPRHEIADLLGTYPKLQQQDN